MSKELEALERLVDGNLKEVNYYKQFCDSATYIMKDKEIIKKALESKEQLEKAFDALSKEDEKTKKLLSLEIEKNRKIQVLEEELGIDFSVLVKALENGIYVKQNDYGYICEDGKNIVKRKVRGIGKDCLIVISSTSYYAEYDDDAYFRAYGKAWALTKEELKNERK